MKYFFYVAVVLLTKTLEAELYSEYNILQEVIKVYDKYTSDSERINFIDGPDGNTAFKFDNESRVLSPVSNTTLNNLKLSSPFILNVMFKFDESDYSCLFAIKNLENLVKLRLCVTPKASDIFELNVDSDGLSETVNIDIYEDLSINWVDIYIVFDKTIKLYAKCSPMNSFEPKHEMVDVYFSRDDWIYVGQSGVEESDQFRGAIDKIILYPDTDNVESVCNDEIYIPDSFKDDLSLLSEGGDEKVEVNMKGDKGEKGDIGARGERGEIGLKGIKGDKGSTGLSFTGPPGPQGPIGPQGTIGKEGPRGEEGICQCSESVVSSLIKKMPELKGPRGEPGPRGEDGDTGATGETGVPGKQGERGPIGLTGVKGIKGDDGMPGKDGLNGLKGEPGRDGPIGPPGPRGEVGHPGPPGLSCERVEEPERVPIPGDRGDVGPQGPPGLPGGKGEKGVKGEVGERGLPGDLGHTGPQGKQGEKGDIGNPGLNGKPGVPGTHGKHGVDGIKGDKGETGNPGIPAKLSSILDDDIDPDEKSMIVEKLKGYKGESGIKGDKGDKGLNGISGIPGAPGRRGDRGERGDIGSAGPKGNKGEKGGTGPPGVVSMSALNRLKGPKGDRGQTGKPGARGYAGHNGAKGSVGPIGQKGSKGDSGVPGPMGTKGSTGTAGIRGEKGESGEIPEINLEKLKGEKGDRGPLGPSGEPGKTGPPGLCQKTEDSVPVPGPPGPPGSPGPPGTPGTPGSPGISVTGPKGEPGGIVSAKTLYGFSDYPVNNVDDDEVFHKMETMIYKTSKGLKRRTRSTPVGTLAYVLEEKVLLLRVERGWQYVVMGSLHQERGPKVPSRTNHNERRRKNFIRLAALDQPYAGNMETGTNRTGRKTVDQECHVQSKKAGFTGTFAAFLANKVEDLKSILKTADKDVAVFNIHQQLLFDSWIDMFNDSGTVAFKSDIYSFTGKNVLIDPTWQIKAVWHGGTSLGVRSPKYFCREWQTDSDRYFGSASKINDNKLAIHEKYTCDKKLIVLCVEVRPNVVRRQRHISRRRLEYERLLNSKI